MTRFLRVFLAAWYFLIATQAPALALDRLTAASKTAATLDFPCAKHGCGCKTAEQCRLRCCCHLPHVQQAAEQEQRLPEARHPGAVRITTLDAMDCEGQPANGGAVAAQRLDPHLPCPKADFRPGSLPKFAFNEPSVFPAFIPADPLDKVPI